MVKASTSEEAKILKLRIYDLAKRAVIKQILIYTSRMYLLELKDQTGQSTRNSSSATNERKKMMKKLDLKKRIIINEKIIKK
ncbi:hypothetical protein [Mesonia mobilis]|uniref:Uncharacterized protein n=1 Tax=Mesonia mobilis TaxID=369791 RepID=A0ABQ3BSX2_9FLAO|nr:hypothetical protein [Mesonia mobilis]GGZ56465.1 hypothetical protein GCM10008088_17550 [Mesonia mobilis]